MDKAQQNASGTTVRSSGVDRRSALGIATGALLVGTGAVAAPTGEAGVIVSARCGDRLTPKPPLAIRTAPLGAAANFRLDPRRTDQTMAGFGASFNEAGMICLNALEPVERERVFAALFNPVHGAGLSVMKTVMGSTDAMSAGPFYTYAEVPGDVELRHFTIERDLASDGLVPYIKGAQRHGSFVLQATMDYPPDWMLIDANVAEKQKVDPRYYPVLARYYQRYIEAYAAQGITIDYLSPFNEPGNYTKITFPELGAFIRDHLGPLFRKEKIKTRLQAAESSLGRAYALAVLPPLLDDPSIRKWISNVAFHGYDYRYFKPLSSKADFTLENVRPDWPNRMDDYHFPEFEALAELHRRYPDVPLWQTETCYYDMGRPNMPPLPRYEFEDGEFWGEQIAADVEAGVSGWIYWNMILDEFGGPPLVEPLKRNPARNIQHPVVIINRRSRKASYTGLYYYLAHFARYVRPGAVRLIHEGKMDGVRFLAFHGPEGGFVAQAINTRDDEVQIVIAIGERQLAPRLAPHSITTINWA